MEGTSSKEILESLVDSWSNWDERDPILSGDCGLGGHGVTVVCWALVGVLVSCNLGNSPVTAFCGVDNELCRRCGENKNYRL